MRGMTVVVLLLGLCGSSAAQDAGALLGCPKKTDDRERLACFDAAMKPVTPATPEPPATPTKDIVAAPANATAPTVFKVVDAEDVYVAPGKYDGRGIEMKRMRCFHADKDEYRCMAAGAVLVTVFSPAIRPDSERRGLEDDCGEIKKMMASPKCEKTVRFVPVKHGEDLVNGYQKRVVVVAPYMELASGAVRGRR